MTHSLNMRRRRRRSARFVPMYPQVLLAAAVGALAKMTTTTNTTTTRRGQPPKREDSTGFGSPSLFQWWRRQRCTPAFALLNSTRLDSTIQDPEPLNLWSRLSPIAR
uniref:(northern house mosquito) hypothetical protein n=1 Tax=Culex pipiens TaxID=7175 RepID=A0A8D8AK02_CULPI